MEWKRLETGDEVLNILSSSLYCIAVWTLYYRHVKSLDQFHQRCLRCILNIKWYSSVSNENELLQVQMQSIDALLTQSAKMIWTSRAHAGQQATKAALLRWADGESSTKGTAKALLQRQPKRIPPEVYHWWKAMGNHSYKQVWMEACCSQGNRSLWKRKAEQSTGKVCSNETRNHHCSAFHRVSSRLCALDFGLRSHMRVHKQTKRLARLYRPR